jgi:hypothetical protein
MRGDRNNHYCYTATSLRKIDYTFRNSDMPTTKKRPSASTVVAKSAIEQAGSSLQALPEKPKQSWSLREAVAVLHADITTALNRGYSYEEVVTLLAKNGVSITVSSLKRYLAAAKRSEGVNKSRRKPRNNGRVSTQQVEAAAVATKNASGAAAKKSSPKAAPKAAPKASEKKASAATKPQANAKTAAKATPKAATQTAKVSRSTPSRQKKN